MNKLIRTIFVVITFYLVAPGVSFATTLTFIDPAANGTPTNSLNIPAGVTSVSLTMVGGGGGGGAGYIGYGGGGGGSGGAIVGQSVAVTPSTSYTVTVGAVGTGGTPSRVVPAGRRTSVFAGTDGVAGGISSFQNINATGGTGGIHAYSGVAGTGGAGGLPGGLPGGLGGYLTSGIGGASVYSTYGGGGDGQSGYSSNSYPGNPGLAGFVSISYNCSSGYVALGLDCLPVGTVNVSSNIGSLWTVTGPATITGSGTSGSYASKPAGTYTITWGSVSGYTAPASQSFTLTSGGTITFSGSYTALTCPNGAVNYPACTTNAGGLCINGAANPSTCDTCASGYTLFNNFCYACTNGAVNYPTCTTNSSGLCINGANNPASCTTCPAGQTLVSGTCTTTVVAPVPPKTKFWQF